MQAAAPGPLCAEEGIVAAIDPALIYEPVCSWRAVGRGLFDS